MCTLSLLSVLGSTRKLCVPRVGMEVEGVGKGPKNRCENKCKFLLDEEEEEEGVCAVDDVVRAAVRAAGAVRASDEEEDDDDVFDG